MNSTGAYFAMTDAIWGYLIPGITAVVLALIALIGKRIATKVDEIKAAVSTEASEIKRTAIAASLAQKIIETGDKPLGLTTNGPRLLSFMLETAQQSMLIAEITKDEKWMESARQKLKDYQLQKQTQDALVGGGLGKAAEERRKVNPPLTDLP